MKTLRELINLDGKTGVVTGGAMGIGYGIAYRLAEAGASVVIADLNEEAGEKAAGELISNGWRVATGACHALRRWNCLRTWKSSRILAFDDPL